MIKYEKLLKAAYKKSNTNKIIKSISYNKIKIGIDLGTAFVKCLFLNEKNMPLLSYIERATVVKDGVVADFFGAVQITKKMISAGLKVLGDVEISKVSVGYPPETDAQYVINVVNSVGYDVENAIDEPSAAAKFLKVKEGIVVDIGGGTTGIAVISNKKVVSSFDEPTGGHHLTLVLAGNKKIKYEEAEQKKISDKEGKYFSIFRPVIEKMAFIVKNNLKNYNTEKLYLVGGPTSYPGFSSVFEKELNKKVISFKYPLLITTYGITL